MNIFSFFKNNNKNLTDTTPTKDSAHKVKAEDTLTRWQQVLAIDPQNLDARIHIANVHSDRGDSDAAARILEELEREHPDSLPVKTAVARFLASNSQTMEARAKWVSIFDDDSNNIEALVNVANLDLQQERYTEALATADRLETLFPRDFRCHLIRGRVYHHQQNWASAADAWRAVLNNKGSHYEAELHLCIALNRMSQFDDVITQLQLSMVNFPDAEPLFALKRRALTRMDRKTEALELTVRALERFPDSAEWYYERANLLYTLQRCEEAEAACQSAIERFGDDVRLLTLYARIGQMQLNRSKVA